MKLKAYTDVQVNGYREALEAAEKSKTTVDAHVIQTWNWAGTAVANTKFHDISPLVAGETTLGIVERVPNAGFEAWRLLNERYNSVGEMYFHDTTNR